MRIYAGLHMHSKYSRATSPNLDIKNIEKYARIKGLNLLGTGDFTHPKWLAELQQLKEENGILKTQSGFPFMWQAEISLIYTQGGKGRKIHYIILAPSGEIVSQINEFLLKKGRLDYDGRPIFGFSSIELVENLMGISTDIEIIPAHAWTPWFSIFGSNSGFDSVEECLQEKTKYIHAIETGMSSDPLMNWRISKLDKFTLVSNPDSHSFWPWRMGREANVFEMEELNYRNVVEAIRTRKGFLETIEVDPNYGKYHFDGHRDCGVSMSPEEALKNKNICPNCRKMLTIGVLHRVEQLADRPAGFVPKGAVPFKRLIPLSEIIAGVVKSSAFSQKTWAKYNALIERFGTEFNVLLEAEEKELKSVADEKLAEAILENREGKIKVRPGYDGEYGKPVIGNEDAMEKNEQKPERRQKQLGDFFNE